MPKINKKKIFLERMILALTLFCLLLFITMFINTVHKIQGTARLINYTGYAQSTTQRLVKFQIQGINKPEIEANISILLDSLRNGNSQYNIIKLEDEDYQEKIDELYAMYPQFSKELAKSRAGGYESSNLIEVSEKFYILADQAVENAQRYANSLALRLKFIEIGLVIIVLCLLVFIIMRWFVSIKLLNKNKELNQMAYIDLHTGLPNKSRCNELLSDESIIDNTTCLIIFDLNYLKKVNDTLGHIAGDTLIQNFANVIRKTVKCEAFVGRFGGDEFICILEKTSEVEINTILDDISVAVEKYNSIGQQIPLSYCCGFAISSDYVNCNLKTLLENADHKMYMSKEKFHREHGNSR